MRPLVRPPGPPGSGFPTAAPQGRFIIPNYGPSTGMSQQAAMVEMVKEIARRRLEQQQGFRTLGANAIPVAGGGINWMRGPNLIGTSAQEDTPVNFLSAPRPLGNPRYR